MDTTELVIALAIITLLLGLVYGIGQLILTRRARRLRQHSAMTAGTQDARERGSMASRR